MPAPELKIQTPGDQLANAISTAGTSNPGATELAAASAQALAPYVAKHNGGGRWIAVTNDEKAEKVGDFVGDKVTVAAEVERLNAGGEPLVLDPTRENEPMSVATPSTTNVDATTLKQAVMTSEGWLCPEPPAAKG